VELPEHPPATWKRKMTMHLNFGHGEKGGGAGIFTVHNETGKQMPFGYQYDTTPGGLTGFTLPGVTDRVFTWAELRAHFKEKADARATDDRGQLGNVQPDGGSGDGS